MKLLELAKKEQETLDVWRKNVEPFSAWLDKTNGKLDEIQNSSGDTENLEQRHLALQVNILLLQLLLHQFDFSLYIFPK